jgi:hypothetical protein
MLTRFQNDRIGVTTTSNLASSNRVAVAQFDYLQNRIKYFLIGYMMRGTIRRALRRYSVVVCALC